MVGVPLAFDARPTCANSGRNMTTVSRRTNKELTLNDEETLYDITLLNGSEQPTSPTSPTQRRLILEWKNLSVNLKSSQRCWTGKSKQHPDLQIISNVNGIAYPGELLAIMGSSGCGKTTMLNALTQRSQNHLNVEGDVLVDGRLISPGQMDAISAYVQQDDLFGGMLTVKEELTFQALLRMSSKLTKTQKLKRVNDMIDELGLTNCQNTLIGVPGRIQGISGGERRRMAFAAEILTDPQIMFCDEPTSGLDTAMAESVVVVLKKMAAKGRTIVCTIHQPSSYQYALFDRILLMAQGRLVFLGSPKEALHFFSRLEYPCPLNYNPADHFIHVLAGINGSRENVNKADIIEKFCHAYTSSVEPTTAFVRQYAKAGRAYVSDPKDNSNRKHTKTSRFKASVGTQLRMVLWRSWLCVIRDKGQLKIRALESLVLAVFLGLIYKDQPMDELVISNMTGLIAIVLSLMTFQTTFAVIQGFCDELPLFFREHWNGLYRTEVYILCKSVADIPGSIFFPLLLGFCPFWMMGIEDGRELLIICAIILLVASICISYGYLITSITNSLVEAMAIVPFLMCPLFLCSGFFINLRSVPSGLKWLEYLSWFKYGNEALSINHWKEVDHIDCNIDKSTCPKNGLVVLDIMGFDPNNLHFDLGAMAILAVAYRLLGLVFLSFRAWRKN